MRGRSESHEAGERANEGREGATRGWGGEPHEKGEKSRMRGGREHTRG